MQLYTNFVRQLKGKKNHISDTIESSETQLIWRSLYLLSVALAGNLYELYDSVITAPGRQFTAYCLSRYNYVQCT